MASSSSEDQSELRVTFFPPLYLQRRIWVLNILRREDVTSVVDIGCGEGELLACLTQPAPWLRPPPESISPKHHLPKSIDLQQAGIANLYCTHIHGLDISAPDLQYAIQGTAPLASSDKRYLRWQPTEVKIWLGGLESMNPEFVGVECIVSTEVIEHLPADILPFYAPMILGVYHPRLFLVTTPSYTFNARFTPPNVTDPAGYPDPTGRTSRVFRHHDHKFEWTVSEFREWCEAAAEEWGYTVIVGVVGTALEPDPWGRDEECGGASQVAEFTRIEGKDYIEMRASKTAAVKLVAEGKHKLLATHHHPAHSNSQQPASLPEISEAVKSRMEQFEETSVRFEELWFEQDIAVLCGGWIELLEDAIEEDERLILRKEKSEKKENWQVDLIGGVQKKETLWSEVDGEDCSPLVNEASSENGSEDGRQVGWDGEGEGQSKQNTDIEANVSHNWETNIGTSSWANSNLWNTPDWTTQTGWEDDEGWGTNHGWEPVSSDISLG